MQASVCLFGTAGLGRTETSVNRVIMQRNSFITMLFKLLQKHISRTMYTIKIGFNF